jgi:carboxypeptidase family protein/TonB-dependent receptor-like protein
MTRSPRLATPVLLALACLLAFPALAHAQSAIAGTVKDPSGAVLPGVTVEAMSPVLIEKVRTVTTNEQGQFTIVDLRPGTYSVRFTLSGFNMFVREGLELPTDFTATINVELRVGILEETVTVTGESPVVDVSSTSRVQVLTREALDALPTGRSIYSMAQLVPGVLLNQPDVGGSRAMQQTYMSTRGLTSANNIVQVDGMMINGLDGDGAVQQYVNNAMIQEMSYQTAGAGADVSPGGLRVNIIPRDGGNRFSGSFFGAWSDGSWQSNNHTPELLARGLRAVDRIEHIYDFNASQGGPIKRDKLWFFGTVRQWSVNSPIADTFYVPAGATQADCQAGRVSCEQGIDDQKIKSALLRLTWQVSPRNKFSLYYDEIDKFRGHGMNAGDDPLTASQIWTSPAYNDGAIRWTSTVSNRLMVDGGFSFNQEQYVITNQDGINKQAGTPEWFAGASRRDADLVTLRNGLANWGGRYPDRYNLQGAVAYVTGAHNIKVGTQYNYGPYTNTRETNADLQQVYRTGVPFQVTVYNTPLRYKDALVADVGIYAQDTWTLQRLTLNGGLRWEYLNSEVSAAESGAGRFVGERKFNSIPMPIWKDFAPRFGMVYDVFGTAKTALKFGLNRYNESRTTFFANAYNPLAITGQNLSWTDLNRDDIAQGALGCTYLTAGCEINFAQLPSNFGSRALNRVDPDFKRTFNVETTAGIQHELLPRISVSANWYRRTFHRLRVTDNLLRTMSDYTPVSVFNPLTGQPFTIHNLNAAALPRIDNYDTNAGSGRKHVYTGYDVNVNARLPRGGTLFGGFVTERNLRNVCDEPDDPNMLLYCDDADNGIPYRPQLKLSGTYPLPWGIQVSAALQSLAGRPIGGFTAATVVNKIIGPGYGDTGSPVGTQWLLSPTTRYPANCPAPCPAGALVIPTLTSASLTVPLVAPGTEFLPRLNQLDLSLGKWFQVGGMRVQGQVDLFNAFNKNTELSYRSTNFATAAYLLPSSVLQGRMVRLGLQMKW